MTLGLSPQLNLSYQVDQTFSILAGYSGHFEKDRSSHGVNVAIAAHF